jgi:dihydrofolate reductase
MIALIAAVTENNVIGANDKLPWRLPKDIRHFKRVTTGQTVVMGRKTWESIPLNFRPLAERSNFVLTHQTNYDAPGATVYHSLRSAIRTTSANQNLFVIGGESLYRSALLVANTIFLTRVHAFIDGDAFFPSLDFDVWKEQAREFHEKDERHSHPFTFFTYTRKE